MGKKIAAKIVRRAWETSKISASVWREGGVVANGAATSMHEGGECRLRIVGDSRAEHNSNGAIWAILRRLVCGLRG